MLEKLELLKVVTAITIQAVLEEPNSKFSVAVLQVG